MKLPLLLTELKGIGLCGKGVIVPADLLVTRVGVDWWGCIEEGAVEAA